MTTFLISPITDCQKEYGGTEGTFKGTDGNLYNYSIDLDVDNIRIEDNCGRMVPFDTTDLPALILVLAKINRYVQTKNLIEERLYDDMVSGTCY